MIRTPKISIIVPVYNTEKYIRNCLDSIRNQTFTDWECIIVDDGSTDSCGEICEEYSRFDDRFFVIHQKNMGSSGARNVGLDKATGKYLSFVDADDWLELNYLSRLYDCAVKEQSDVVICGFYRNYTNGTFKSQQNQPSKLTGKCVILESLSGKLHAGLWNKLILREFIESNGIRFPKYNYYEDMYFTLSLFTKKNTISYCADILYHYRYNISSQSFHTDVNRKFEQFEDFSRNMSSVMEENPHLWKDEDIVNALFFRVNIYKFEMMLMYSSYHNQLIRMLSFFPDSIKKETSLGKRVLFYTVSKLHIFLLLKSYIIVHKLLKRLHLV